MKAYNLTDLTGVTTQTRKVKAMVYMALISELKGGMHPINFDYNEIYDDIVPEFTAEFLEYLEHVYKIALSPFCAMAFVSLPQIINVMSHVPLGEPENIQPQNVVICFQVKYNIFNPETNAYNIYFHDMTLFDVDVSSRFFQTMKDKEGK